MEKKEAAPKVEEKTEKKSKKPEKQEKKQPLQKQGQPKPSDDKKEAVDSNFRHLVRVSGVVLNGDKPVFRVLPIIKGIGFNTSLALTRGMGIGKDVKLGSLTEQQVAEIEENIRTLNQRMPKWMVNRQKDYETGQYLHLTGAELEFSQREDITRHKKIKSYKGVRHILGLPVRGQRTRTSFRTGSAIGVSRKKTAAAAAAAKAPPKAAAAATAEKPKEAK
jgi:small subunit ribosomal protein S13